MSEDFLLALHLDFIPTRYAQATSPQDNMNVMRQHKAFLRNTRSVPIMGLPKELADSPAIGGGTNLQLLLHMTAQNTKEPNQTTPRRQSPSATPGGTVNGRQPSSSTTTPNSPNFPPQQRSQPS